MLNDGHKSEIINALKKVNPHRIILFGSYAYETENTDSDLDLYVITKDDYTPETYREKLDLKCKISRVLDPFRILYPIDLIVHTLPMFKKFVELDSSFSREILNNGVVLYEADHA